MSAQARHFRRACIAPFAGAQASACSRPVKSTPAAESQGGERRLAVGETGQCLHLGEFTAGALNTTGRCRLPLPQSLPPCAPGVLTVRIGR